MVTGTVSERTFLHASGGMPSEIDTATAWAESRHWRSKLALPDGAWSKGQPPQPGPVLARLKYNCELLKEYVFEDVRRAAFPELPSRRRCMYLLDSSHDPAAFASSIGLDGAAVYVVEVVSGCLHRAELAALDCNLRPHSEIEAHARRYWTHAEPGDGTEVLFEGVCRLLRA